MFFKSYLSFNRRNLYGIWHHNFYFVEIMLSQIILFWFLNFRHWWTRNEAAWRLFHILKRRKIKTNLSLKGLWVEGCLFLCEPMNFVHRNSENHRTSNGIWAKLSNYLIDIVSTVQLKFHKGRVPKKKTTKVWTYVQTVGGRVFWSHTFAKKKVWTSNPIVYPTYLSTKFGHFLIEVCP